MIEKAHLYAEANIVEYWVVDVQSKCVHVLRKPTTGKYADCSVAKIGEQLSPLEACENPLDLSELYGS